MTLVRNTLFCLFFFVLVFGLNVSAHGSPFLELNPDYFRVKIFNISGQTSVYELFIPQNDFLNGFDFWADNNGSSGDVIFKLYSPDDILLSTKTITIPHIDPVPGGQRIHIDLNFQFPVVSGGRYSIKIESLLSQLALYYFDKINLVNHNAPFPAKYLTGLVKLDGEEQDFSFKYALYEGAETAVPVISNLTWAEPSQGEIKFSFNANEPVDYRIEYGPSGKNFTDATNFSGEYNFCVFGIANCGLEIKTLSGGTYQYSLTVKDSWGNQSRASGTFISSKQALQPSPILVSPILSPVPPTTTTESFESASPSPSPSSDIVSPFISNLKIASVTDKSVDVAWTTNEAANSQVIISFTTELLTIAGSSDAAFELEHLLKTNQDLEPGTKYLARISSRDMADNVATASIGFTTLSKPPSNIVPSPNAQPTGVSQPVSQVNSITVTEISSDLNGSDKSSVLVEWEDNFSGSDKSSGGYRIDIFDETGSLKESISVPSDSKSVEVKNLPDGKYSIIVYKNNNGVFEKVERPAELKIGQSFMEEQRPILFYLFIALVVLLLLAWRLFKKKSSSV